MDLPKNLKKYAHLFCVLAKVRDLKILRDILKGQKLDFFKTLSSICKNILVGNLQVSKTQKRKLKAFSANIRALYGSNDLTRQRSILLRAGGGMLIFEIARILEPSLLQAISKSEKR